MIRSRTVARRSRLHLAPPVLALAVFGCGVGLTIPGGRIAHDASGPS